MRLGFAATLTGLILLLFGAVVAPSLAYAASGTSAGPAAQITAGSAHTCAVSQAGAALCWGWGRLGQLGDGTTMSSKKPRAVLGLTSGVAQISAGFDHTCAVTTSGAALCWGHNHFGQLGDGTTTSSSLPVAVSGLGSGVAQISAAGDHSCALLTSGSAMCWGANHNGELGNGTGGFGQFSSVPVQVSGLGSGVAQLSVGSNQVCAVTTAGAALCWGRNDFGQLGDGKTGGNRLRPVSVSGLTSGSAQISSGYDHTCAVTTSGGALCWGENQSGQLGDGTLTQSPTPVGVYGLSSGVRQIAAAQSLYSCAILSTGAAKCWGSGALGNATTTSSKRPVQVSGLTSGVQQISAGGGHTCAVTSAGVAMCWGSNLRGQLGDGTHISSSTPVNVLGLP
jgi:alpha-tubulin suppressor-like RCC1 family protein